MKNVLVVEDERECNQLLCDVVTECREDVSVFSAENEKEAMQIALKCRIDLFLIDISLKDTKGSDVSGVMFARWIRNIDYYEVTPIIFVTSIANLELHMYRQISCYSYIVKPLDEKKQKQLSEQVEVLLKNCKTLSKDEYLYLKIEAILYPVKIDDIIMIRCVQRHLEVTTGEECFLVQNTSLKQIQKDLNQMRVNPFVECRRGVMVNLDHVEYIDRVNHYVKMKHREETIDYGRSRWLSKIQGVVEVD